MFNITLSDGKEIEIIAVQLNKNMVDFRWVDGVYTGDCSFPCELTSLEDISGQIEIAANSQLCEMLNNEVDNG
jgi:hypothetical protein